MVAEPVIRVVGGVAVELICGSMEALATALGVDQNHDAGAATVFRVEVAGQGLEFTDCIEAQSGVFAVVRAYVGVDDAVEEEVVGRAAHAVHIEVVGLVEDQAELRIVVGNHAGQRGEQGFEVTAVQRLLRNLALVDNCRIARCDRVDQGVSVFTVTVCDGRPT